MIPSSGCICLNWSKTASFKEANSTPLNHWFSGDSSCLRHAFMRTNAEAQLVIFRKWSCVGNMPLLELSWTLFVTGSSFKARARGSQEVINSLSTVGRQTNWGAWWQSQVPKPHGKSGGGRLTPDPLAPHPMANVAVMRKVDLSAFTSLRGRSGTRMGESQLSPLGQQDLSYLNEEQ